MGQVMQNLLKNSMEAFTNGGWINVHSQESEHNGKIWIELTIEDNGPGMTEEIKKQMFSPYFTTKTKGTGLGLAIVHRIVTEHGGNILVESEPGKGTRFEIRLPLDE
jgi:signal transduction histidine kinase